MRHSTTSYAYARERSHPPGRTVPVFVLALAFAPSLSACGDSGVGGRPGGVPGSNNLPPECGALAQACLGQRNDTPLALGSRTEFTVDFQNAGQAGLDISIQATEPTVLRTDGWFVEAVGPGISGLLVLGADGESVIDFVHTWVSVPDELRILAWSTTGDLLGVVQPQVTLLTGDEVLISVEPYENAQPLLGNFVLDRTIDGDAVAIVPDPVGGLYRVVARNPGLATITFDALGLQAVWEIEVLQ